MSTIHWKAIFGDYLKRTDSSTELLTSHLEEVPDFTAFEAYTVWKAFFEEWKQSM